MPASPHLPAARPHAHPQRRFASLRTVFALMLREMSTTYGRSPGGYLWAVLEPVAGIALLTAVFSVAFEAPPLGRNFAFFYATGMVPFLMYNSVSGKVATALLFSKPLLNYPTVTFVDALFARFVLNYLTELMVAYVVFVGLFVIFDPQVIIDMGTILHVFCMLAALTLGVGTLNAFLFTRFQAWQRAWSILMRPMFIVSCIFFLFETIPLPYRDWLWYNPLVHIIGLTRAGFYPTYEASYVTPLYVYGVSIGCALTGLILLRRYHRDILQR